MEKGEEHRAELEALKENRAEDNLWNCIVVFQHHPFYTASGLPFTYSLKVGRGGKYTKELFIDRRESSKSLSWSSIRLAFAKCEGMDVVDRPKAIGDIRGISYIYSLFWRFGVITVPEEIAVKLRGTESREAADSGPQG